MASPDEWFFFDPAERALVDDSLRIVARGAAELREYSTALLDRLARLAELIRASPPIGRPAVAGSRPELAPDALIASLCSQPEFALELNVPTKVAVGRSYLIAKINFLKALAYAVEEVAGSPEVQERLRVEVGQAIYSKLAEDLLVAILTDASTEPAVLAAASRVLLQVWDDPLLAEVDDYAPFLEGAWRARATVKPVLGTMLGTQEMYQLLAATSDYRLCDHFESDSATQEEMESFEEFLFGLSYEDIQRLRADLALHHHAAISLADGRRVLGLSPLAPAADEDTAAGAQAMYISYKRRRLNASHRAMTGSPGPRKTAEEYVMIAVLRRSDRAR